MSEDKRTAEPQNIPPEADRMSKGGIATLGLFYKIDRIHYSMFDVGRSMFDVHFLVNSSFDVSCPSATDNRQQALACRNTVEILRFMKICDTLVERKTLNWGDSF
jgi:hypothetical protein